MNLVATIIFWEFEVETISEFFLIEGKGEAEI